MVRCAAAIERWRSRHVGEPRNGKAGAEHPAKNDRKKSPPKADGTAEEQYSHRLIQALTALTVERVTFFDGAIMATGNTGGKNTGGGKPTPPPNPNYPSTRPGKPSGPDRGNTPKPSK
jgi:hypothetical protein